MEVNGHIPVRPPGEDLGTHCTEDLTGAMSRSGYADGEKNELFSYRQSNPVPNHSGVRVSGPGVV